MFPGGTRAVLRKGAILPSTHAPFPPQPLKPTSSSSCVSPAAVVVSLTKQTRAASQLRIKIHQAKKNLFFFFPPPIPLPCFILAERRVREGAGREEGIPFDHSTGWYWPKELMDVAGASKKHLFLLAKRAPAL